MLGLIDSWDVEYNGTENEALFELVCDTAADLTSLTHYDDIKIRIGSECKDMETGDTYLKSSNAWIKQPSDNAFENTYTQEQIDNLLAEKVGTTDYATPNQYGVVKLMTGGGLRVDGENPLLCVNRANQTDIDEETQQFKPIVPYTIPYMMAKYGITSKTIISDHNAELARLIDSGAKNSIKTNAGTSIPENRFIEIPLSDVKAGAYILYFGHIESTLVDTTCNVSIRDASNNTVTTPSEFQFSQGDGVYREIRVTADTASKIRIYSANNFANSLNQSVSFTDAMLCPKSAWDISQTYVPYCPSLQELYDLVQSYHT